jgi:hypothetical protein
MHTKWRLLLFFISFCYVFAGICRGAEHMPSGPITINEQNGTVLTNLHISSTNGNCITINNSTNITIENSDIGPCGTAGSTVRGNGVSLTNSGDIYIFDNYIHPESASSECCDHHDGIFGSGGNRNVTIQGNVIAYGESNIEFTKRNSSIIVIGNFLLNPRGPQPRGQNFQCYGADTDHVCSAVIVNDNFTLSSLNTKKYLYPDNQEDSLNFGLVNGGIAQNNYITGGHSRSGCGLMADDRANNMRFEGNLLLNTGQCGIGIADGMNELVINNKIYNETPVPRGGNTAIYTWKQYHGACGPTIISNNVADMLLQDGRHNAYWDGGGCGTALSGNIFNSAADALLTPASSALATPLIPPQPKKCVAASPYTTNTTAASGLPLCSASAVAY